MIALNASARRSRHIGRVLLVTVGIAAGAAIGLAASTGLAMARSDATPAGVPAAFPFATLDDWRERRFEGSTDYRIDTVDGVRILRAQTDSAASLLYLEREVDLVETPRLEWWWKPDSIYVGIDEQSREGDDFPARLYVVAKTGPLPWQAIALNYVWSSSTPVGSEWRNPFTDKAAMIAVRSGDRDIGRWQHESRDVRADFERIFGERIDEIAGFAVMVDGDNSGRRGGASFGDIRFTRE